MKVYFATSTKELWKILNKFGVTRRLVSYWYVKETKHLVFGDDSEQSRKERGDSSGSK